MVIKNILLALEAGLGNGETPIFPIHIFKVKEGVNYNPKDPNYDLFKLSCEVSAKRLFPNFSFIDAPFNKQFYKKGDPNTEIAYMGCVRGNETITYRIEDVTYNESFADAWERIKKNNVSEYGISEYIDTDGWVEIYDSVENRFVNCKKFIKNPNKNNWVTITFSNGNTLTCTTDHPLPVVCANGSCERTYVSDIIPGDFIPTTNHAENSGTIYFNGIETNLDTVEIISIEDVNIDECSYDVETESDRFDVSGIISHNCRTRVISNVNDPTREVVTSRGNLSFTSINLPRLAIMGALNDPHNGTHTAVETFFELLDEMMNHAIDQLMHRFRIQCQRKVKNHPFLMGQGVWMDSEKLSPDDTLEEVLKHGSLSVGFIGLAEALKVLTGYHHGESKEAWDLGYKIIKHMRDRMDEEAEKTKLNFSLLATPAEGLSGRFVKIDAKRFGKIPEVTDREYYTNSFHQWWLDIYMSRKSA